MAREQLGRGLCARLSGSKGFLRATTRSLSVRSRACALSYECRRTRGAKSSAASRSRAKSARFGSRLRPPLLPDWEMLARRRNRLPHLGSGSTCHLRALASSRNTRPRELQSPPLSPLKRRTALALHPAQAAHSAATSTSPACRLAPSRSRRRPSTRSPPARRSRARASCPSSPFRRSRTRSHGTSRLSRRSRCAPFLLRRRASGGGRTARRCGR